MFGLVTFLASRFDTIPVIEIGKLVETHIAQFLPDTVITHHCQDANSDHRITFRTVNTLHSPSARKLRPHSALCFETPSSANGDLSTPFSPACLLMYQTRSMLKLRHLIAILKQRDVNFLFPRSPKVIPLPCAVCRWASRQQKHLSSFAPGLKS